jgi:hypothetical protein
MESFAESARRGGIDMKASVPEPVKAHALRTENERKALDLFLQAIREIRYGVVSVVLQDGLVVQIECSEKYRLLTRREVELAGGGDGI